MTMSITGLLRSNLPSTSKSASSPRVSSPLATHSSSLDSGSDNEGSSEEASSSDSSNDSSDEEDEDDSDAELGKYLARAKENARRRKLALVAPATSAASIADSAIAGPSINLEHSDLIHDDDDGE